MGYQPFLIAPFSTGLDTDQQPWILPQDAFDNIENASIRHGVIEKRDGFLLLGDLVHNNGSDWNITNITQASPPVVTVASTAGLANGDIVEIRDVTGMTQVNDIQFEVANLGGTTFELSGANSTNYTAYGGAGTVNLVPCNRVMGLWNFVDTSNVRELLAWDTERMCKYSTVNQRFTPVDTADIFLGSDPDADIRHIWASNWTSSSGSASAGVNRTYFTNGVAYNGTTGGIRFYSGGTTTTLFRPQINASAGGPFIEGAHLIFTMNQRLLLFNTTEGNNSFPQRLRWCRIQNPSGADSWDDNRAGRGGFVDAPTSDHIVSGRQLQNQIIIYCTNTIWSVRPTPNPALPFKWEKINDFRAIGGRRASVGFDRYAVSAGVRGLIATDGVESRRFDERIEDFTGSQVNDVEFEKVFMQRSYEERRMWTLYADSESIENDSALIFDEESGAFSKYILDMNVLGHGSASQDAAIDDFGDRTIDSFGEATLQDFHFDDGSEILIGGDINGQVHIMEVGAVDRDELTAQILVTGATQALPCVVSVTSAKTLEVGDCVYIDDVTGMTELNGKEYTVGATTSTSITLTNVDSRSFTAYAAPGADLAGGIVRRTGQAYTMELDTAAWNPWKEQGKQARLGYIDFFVDTHQSTLMTVGVKKNNQNFEYSETTVNLLPNLGEITHVVTITNANPAVVTAPSHGLSTGDQVFIYGVQGMTSVNDVPYSITRLSENTFSIPVDTTSFNEYTGGGVVTENQYSQTKVWKRVYAGDAGYQHKLRITSTGKNQAIRIHAIMPWFRPTAVRTL